MQKLSEYNREYNEERRKIKEGWIGIACDNCSHELKGSDYRLMSNPPQQDIWCDNCGFKGRRFT